MTPVDARLERILAASDQAASTQRSGPSPVEHAELAYAAFELGITALNRLDHALALLFLQRAVSAGIEEARPLMNVCLRALA